MYVLQNYAVRTYRSLLSSDSRDSCSVNDYTTYLIVLLFSFFQMRVMCQEAITTEGGVVVGSGAGPTELYPNDESADDVGRENVFVLNDTREALSHDGSEHNSVSQQ